MWVVVPAGRVATYTFSEALLSWASESEELKLPDRLSAELSSLLLMEKVGTLHIQRVFAKSNY